MDREFRGRRAVIFANGEVSNLLALRQVLFQDDFLIAADGGTRHLLGLGLHPHLLVGDLDSIPKAARSFLDLPGLEVILHPPEKDETDLELALSWALNRPFTAIRIAGAVGGRLDHALGNLMLLTGPLLEGVDIRIDDGVQEIAAIRSQIDFHGSAGDLLSLIPIEDSHGVTTKGLQYPLVGETLFRHRTRGISNVFTGEVAEVSLDTGLLIGVHTRQAAGISPEGDTYV